MHGVLRSGRTCGIRYHFYTQGGSSILRVRPILRSMMRKQAWQLFAVSDAVGDHAKSVRPAMPQLPQPLRVTVRLRACPAPSTLPDARAA